MDILLNAANAALLLAHDLRRDVEVGLLLLGPPDPPRFVRLEGFRLRSYQPDIRSNAALVRRALQMPPESNRRTPRAFLVQRRISRRRSIALVPHSCTPRKVAKTFGRRTSRPTRRSCSRTTKI